MDFDLHRGLRDLGEDPEIRAAAPPLARVLHRAHRRRAARLTTLSVVGATTAAAAVLGTMVLTGTIRPDPAPPVVVPTTTAAPSPIESTSPSEPASTLSPGPAWTPNLSRCGMAGDTWMTAMTDQDTHVLVGDYLNSGIGSVAGTVAQVDGNVIWDTDLAGQDASVEVLDAVVISLDESGATGSVVAVLGDQQDPSSVTIGPPTSDMTKDASDAPLRIDLPLATCDSSTALQDGTYVLIARVEVTVGTDVTTVWGGAWLTSGPEPTNPPATADTPTTPPIDPTVDLTHEVPACGTPYSETEEDWDYAAGDPKPLWWIDYGGGFADPRVSFGVMRESPEARPYAYTDLVAVLVRRSDHVVVAQTPLDAVPQHLYTDLPLQTGLTGRAYVPGNPERLGVASFEWDPVGCADLGGGVVSGKAIDVGAKKGTVDVADDHGFTAHVGQRLLFPDGTTRWEWRSLNPNDPLYYPRWPDTTIGNG